MNNSAKCVLKTAFFFVVVVVVSSCKSPERGYRDHGIPGEIMEYITRKSKTTSWCLFILFNGL